MKTLKFDFSVHVLTFIFLLTVMAVADSGSDTFQKKLTFHPGGLISLKNINGNVEITSWDRDEVEITAFKKVYGVSNQTAEKMLAKIEIVIEQHDNELSIETVHPERGDKNFFSWLFGGKNNSFSVQYELKVPHRVDLNIHTTNGNVEADQISGRVRLESTNGKIIGTDITGLARCHTTNGSINFALIGIDHSDEMIFNTTNGSITLDLPQNYAGYIDLKTTNGHIDCDFPVEVDSQNRRTLLRGRIGSGDADIKCSTTNGSIHLQPVE